MTPNDKQPTTAAKARARGGQIHINLSPEIYRMLDELVSIYGSKQAAVVVAIERLHEKHFKQE